MATINFSKMHGLGNDFVVINNLDASIQLTENNIRQLADRHTGIGFDQLLLLESYTRDEADFSYRIFNANGAEVEQCGNGARCAAKFLQNLTQRSQFRLKTCNRILSAECLNDNLVRVDMGAPIFEPAAIPFLNASEAKHYRLDVDGQTIDCAVVNMGNPHCILTVANSETADVAGLGAKLTDHPSFPQGVNVNFMELLADNHIKLRVYERGVGETLACGSGACASVVAGIHLGQLTTAVDVELPGGQLHISWQGNSDPVWLTGPAAFVFEGKITL